MPSFISILRLGQIKKAPYLINSKLNYNFNNFTDDSIVENDELTSGKCKNKLPIILEIMTSNLIDHFRQVFNKSFHLKEGSPLVIQQIKALVLKRVWILFGRYFLAGVILFMPAILEFFFAILIPSTTYLVNTNDNEAQFAGKYKLGINSYGKFTLPVYVNGSYSTVPLMSLLKNFYTPQNR